MKRSQFVHGASTGLFCAFLLLTGIAYFTYPNFVAIYDHLGFPQYFRIELGIAKILGVLLLLIPRIYSRVKEWVYAGFGITLLSGLIAHTMNDDSVWYVINVLFFFMLLTVSYTYWHKVRKSTQSLPQPKNLLFR